MCKSESDWQQASTGYLLQQTHVCVGHRGLQALESGTGRFVPCVAADTHRCSSPAAPAPPSPFTGLPPAALAAPLLSCMDFGLAGESCCQRDPALRPPRPDTALCSGCSSRLPSQCLCPAPRSRGAASGGSGGPVVMARPGVPLGGLRTGLGPRSKHPLAQAGAVRGCHGPARLHWMELSIYIPDLQCFTFDSP